MPQVAQGTLFERILVPLDGSPEAESILYQAQKILCSRKGEVLLFRVLDAASGPADPEAVGKYMRGVEKRLTAGGARARHVVRSGPVETALLETIRSEHISLVALSSHGRQTSADVPVASTVETIVRASDVPVFVSRAFEIGPDGSLVPYKCEPSNIRRILVPLDGAGTGEAVVPYATELALLLGALVVILHVDPDQSADGENVWNRVTGAPEGPVPGKESSPGERVAFAAKSFSAAGLQTMALTLGGDPATTLLQFARPSAVDLIAMTTHGQGGPAEHKIGGVAERVLKDALLPTLFVSANGTAGTRLRE
jgi:nucleotide-binding universal stress UspA family protein